MKFPTIILLAIAISTVSASEFEIEKIELANGVILLIAETTHSVNMPWVFYDQSVKSIPSIYPNSVIVAEERLGITGSDDEVIYSIVGYKESGDSNKVSISGIATVKVRAWTFDLQVRETYLTQTIQLVLQELSKLPYNKRMQSDLQKATPFVGG